MTSTTRSDQFISVIETHRGILHKIANVYATTPEDRKDLIQEIVLQLWKAFDNYDPRFKYSTWIYKVSLNVSLAFSRKEHNRLKHVDPLRDDLVQFADQDEPAAMETRFRFLQQFIAELRAIDRAILLLYLEEKSQREMAEIIGITETNISTRVGRIKAQLKKKFDQIQK
ncbi:MAG TPA: sigma-70 family RNA polymerase sigma factor [Puia sp.]|nr:sigma-70 family RNA polymerase sigma factor [Puia sp.]